MNIRKLLAVLVIIAHVSNSLVDSARATPAPLMSAGNTIILQDDFEGDLATWQVSAPSPNQAVIADFRLEDDFESGLDSWVLTGNVVATSMPTYDGITALLLDYAGDYMAADRSFAQSTNLRSHVYFYDNGATTMGTVFQLLGGGEQINCGSDPFPNWVPPNTGLGVKTDVTGAYYVIRINCAGEVGGSGTFIAEEVKMGQAPVPVPRTIGWHLFELIVTPFGTYARIDDREVARFNSSQTDATSVRIVSTWELDGQAVYDSLSIQAGYQSGKSLLLDYVDPDGINENSVMVTQSFTASQNIVARTFFYDTMDPSLGSIFEIDDTSGDWQTALGVVSDISNTEYAIRLNSRSGTVASGVPRSAGWHLFEIIVTEDGTYAKIDNRLLAASNPGHTSAAKVKYVSTWGAGYGLLGQALYDGLLIVAADTASWQDQLYTPLRVHYQRYSALVPPDDSTIFTGLYSQLGYCPPAADPRTCGWNSNDLRSLMGAVLAWYLYGEKTSDPTAQALAERLFLEGWANAPWKRAGQDVDNWERGAVMRMMAYATYVLWDDLDLAIRQQIFQDLYNQALTYVNRLPESGYIGDSKAEENAWHAAFLAAMANLFPDMEATYDMDWIDTKARCFAYHAITQASDKQYCGVETQTVWSDWHLENHSQDNPLYASAVISFMGESAFTYQLAGRPVPWEFTHNVAPFFAKYMTYVDLNTYAYKTAPLDWSGAHSTAFTSPTVFRYMDLLGIPTGIDWQDYMAKRSIFYYNMPSSWLKKTPEYIRLQVWNQVDQTEDSYKFFLDTIDAGEFYTSAILGLELQPLEPKQLFIPIVQRNNDE